MRQILTAFVLLFFLGSCTQTSKQTEFKVMSFNIRLGIDSDGENAWKHRKEGALQLIEKYNPQIIGFQEALPHQVYYIDSSLQNYSYIGCGRDGGNWGEACPIFYDTTKYLLDTEGTFWLSETMDTALLGWDAAYPRICTYASFKGKVSNSTFWIFNTHLDNKGQEAKNQGAALVVKKIKELTKPNDGVLLMGDMNSVPESTPIQNFKEYLNYAADISKDGLTGPDGTFNGFEPNAVLDYRIDYQFVKNMGVNSYEHINDKLRNGKCVSDHLPVMGAFYIK